jgi:hypothetical protein
MKKTPRFLLTAAFFMLSSAAFGSQLWIFPSIGPSDNPSGSFDAYTANVAAGLEAGFVNDTLTTNPTGGTPGTPDYFAVATGKIDQYALVTTSYKSWLGDTSAASPYNNEYGNALYFTLAVTPSTPGETFTLADITFELTTPPVPGFSLAGATFSANTVGYACAPGDLPGAGSCTRYDQSNPGSDSTPINYLFTYGFLVSDFSSNPADLGEIASSYDGQTIAAAYHAPDSEDATSSNLISAVPEPGTLALFGFGFLGIAYRLRKKKA